MDLRNKQDVCKAKRFEPITAQKNLNDKTCKNGF